MGEGAWRVLLERLRSAWAVQVELHERLGLLDRPWEEEMAHWCWDGRSWHLHGSLPPPADGRRRSTTRGGWCPGLRGGPLVG